MRQYENSSTFIALGFASVDLEIKERTEVIFQDGLGNNVPPDPNTWMSFTQTGSASDSGAIVSAGFRGNFGGQIEYGVRIDSLFIDGSELGISVDLLYEFINGFALQLSGEIAEEEVQLGLGLRYLY